MASMHARHSTCICSTAACLQCVGVNHVLPSTLPRSVFEVFSAYNLLLGQPSLCHTDLMTTTFGHLWQRPGNVLHYVSMVEIMVGGIVAAPDMMWLRKHLSMPLSLYTNLRSQAPTFKMDFFRRFITPSLYNAWTGWGVSDWRAAGCCLLC